MSERFVLNETSIFGRGCRSELPGGEPALYYPFYPRQGWA